MAEERGEMEPERPSRDSGEFRRMIDGPSREELLRLVARLSADIQQNPGETGVLAAKGWLYGELGDHLRSAEDHGRIIELEP